MKRLNVLFLACCVLLIALISCAQPKPFDAAKVRAAIEAANAKFMDAFNQSDAAGVAALYTEDAALLPPNGDRIQGREAVQAFWQGAMDMGVTEAQLTTVQVGGGGDFAWEIGNYSLKIQPAGQEAMSDKGKYVVIWKKQTDGGWKLHVDIWNTSTPMPAQE